MFCLLILGKRFPIRYMQARLWSSSIVIWLTQVFGDLHSGPWNVLINSLNFRREVKPLTSSGREFQTLGSSVLRLFSPNVVVFTLLTTQWFFLLAKCGLFRTKCVLSLDLRILKSSLLISTNGTLPWWAVSLLIVSCCAYWSSYYIIHYTVTSKHVPVFSLFSVTRGQNRNDTEGDSS